MKFIVEANILSAAMKRVSGVIETKSTIPILTNVMITADKASKTVTLCGTDLDIEVSVELPALVEFKGGLTTSAHLLEAYVGKTPKGAQLLLESDGGHMTCQQGRSSVRMQTLPVEDYPTFQSGDMPFTFVMTATEFGKLLGDVRVSISTEETRYYLNGVYLHPRNNAVGAPGISACSTDGHRLSLAHHPMPDPRIQEYPGIIVPRKTVLLLMKLCDGQDSVSVAYSQSKISADFGKVKVISKLIDGTFPDYERVIPRGNNAIATINRAAMSAAVDRVTTISSDKGRATKLSFEGNKLVIGCNDPDRGSAVEEMDIGYEADPLEIGFNSKYVLDMLGSYDGDELNFAISDPGSPVIIQKPGDPNRMSVLMPMRV